MTTEDAIREELVNLLRYANATAVGKALGVSAQTVINWSEGKHPSQTRLDQVRALYGLPVASQDTKKEAAPPAVEERLARVESLLVEIARATPGVRPELVEIHERVLELERARQQRDESGLMGDPDVQGMR